MVNPVRVILCLQTERTAPAVRRAEKAARLILREGVIAQHDVPCGSVRAGDEEADRNGAVVCDHGAHAAVVLDGIEKGLAAGAGAAKGCFINQHIVLTGKRESGEGLPYYTYGSLDLFRCRGVRQAQ